MKFGFIDNAAFRSINSGIDMLKASGHLRKMRDLNLLEQRPQGSATYYIPGSRLINTLEENERQRSLFTVEIQPVDKTTNPGDKTTNPVDNVLYTELKQSNPKLALEIENVGKRGTLEEIEILILRLCNWKTLKSIEIASLVGRNQDHIKTAYLRRMIRDELLEYKFPENPSHKKQAYRTTDKGKRELR